MVEKGIIFWSPLFSSGFDPVGAASNPIAGHHEEQLLYQSGKEPGLVFNRPDCVGKLTHRIQSSFEGKLDSISQGSVLPNPPNAWRWTRKVAGKTVSVGLSAQKALLMLKAIENQRAMDQIIDEMRAITQRLILDDPLPEKARPKKS